MRDGNRKLRFVQLYTSKSYADRRSMLVRPTEEENENALVSGKSLQNDNSNLEKHVLSPLLVDAISKTAQVVWANTKKQEGLTGRSDIRLQTAVGMPVAVDSNGNMCVVVMFSPNNIQSTDDAIEYLQSISRSASSSSIPSLLPAFDPKAGVVTTFPHHHPTNQFIPLLASSSIDGVTTRFVSLDENPHESSEPHFTPEVHSAHDLAAAPKDCFGIPMLPSFAELGATGYTESYPNALASDAFDEASYGVWSTIMENIEHIADNEEQQSYGARNTAGLDSFSGVHMSQESHFTVEEPVYAINKAVMPCERRERLEEFVSAFLDVSVFDAADVWIPIGGQSDYLGHVTSVTSTETNESLNEFQRVSEGILIKYWSGAVGRAFSSGNPVWSANPVSANADHLVPLV